MGMGLADLGWQTVAPGTGFAPATVLLHLAVRQDCVELQWQGQLMSSVLRWHAQAELAKSLYETTGHRESTGASSIANLQALSNTVQHTLAYAVACNLIRHTHRAC